MTERDLDSLFRTQVNVDQWIQFAVHCDELGKTFRTLTLGFLHVVPNEGTLCVVTFFPVNQTAAV